MIDDGCFVHLTEKSSQIRTKNKRIHAQGVTGRNPGSNKIFLSYRPALFWNSVGTDFRQRSILRAAVATALGRNAAPRTAATHPAVTTGAAANTSAQSTTPDAVHTVRRLGNRSLETRSLWKHSRDLPWLLAPWFLGSLVFGSFGSSVLWVLGPLGPHVENYRSYTRKFRFLFFNCFY